MSSKFAVKQQSTLWQKERAVMDETALRARQGRGVPLAQP